jgi:hypothetical protein
MMKFRHGEREEVRHKGRVTMERRVVAFPCEREVEGLDWA